MTDVLSQVRSYAADVLYLNVASEEIELCDWSAPIAELKSAVAALRRRIGSSNAGRSGIPHASSSVPC